MTQVFSGEFCEISKNTFFHITPLVAASVVSIMSFLLLRLYRLVKKYMSLSNGRWLTWSALLMKCIQHLYRNRLLGWLSLKQWSKYWLCKICQSKCFLWPAFSRIKTESSIIPFCGKMMLRGNPYSGIFYVASKWTR